MVFANLVIINVLNLGLLQANKFYKPFVTVLDVWHLAVPSSPVGRNWQEHKQVWELPGFWLRLGGQPDSTAVSEQLQLQVNHQKGDSQHRLIGKYIQVQRRGMISQEHPVPMLTGVLFPVKWRHGSLCYNCLETGKSDPCSSLTQKIWANPDVVCLTKCVRWFWEGPETACLGCASVTFSMRWQDRWEKNLKEGRLLLVSDARLALLSGLQQGTPSTTENAVEVKSKPSSH